MRATLALGLVIGAPAGLSAASWVDAESVGGRFSASRFEVQTNVAQQGWTDAGTVTTSVAGIYPGGGAGSAYVRLSVRTGVDSVAGQFHLSASANAGGGLAPALRYRVVRIDGACAASAFSGTPDWVVGSALTSQPVASSLTTTAPRALAAAGASTVTLCIEYLLADGTTQATYQGTSATATLVITGSST